MLIPKPSANNKAVKPPIPCTCTAHENPSLQIPSPESSRQQTHGYAKVFIWMAIVRDVRHYSRVSRIPANQVVPQGGMQQSLLILGETGPTLRSRIYTKRTPCTRIFIIIVFERILDSYSVLRNTQVVHQQNLAAAPLFPNGYGKGPKGQSE